MAAQHAAAAAACSNSSIALKQLVHLTGPQLVGIRLPGLH